MSRTHDQGDLFAAPAPPLPAGLIYQPDLISEAMEASLLAGLEALDLQPFSFHGWKGNREVTSFGWRYDFDNAAFTPVRAIPPFLVQVRDRAAALSGLEPSALVQLLVTRYRPGAGIGWHRDRPVFGTVVGVSLKADSKLRFRRRTASGFERHTIPLARRSAYVLRGEARHDWEHSIAPQTDERWSLTFRSLSAKGEEIARLGV